MIGKLQGLVDFIGDNYAIIMVGGVGYRVFCPISVLADLRMGELATLWIETNVREDHIHLFGFDSRSAQDLFLKLTSVSGVGPKMGMAIMGAFRANVLMSAIASGDVKTLTAAPGVGKKVAERIIVELRGKLETRDLIFEGSGYDLQDSNLKSQISSHYMDLLSALETLGYRRADVVDLAQRLVRENPNADVTKLVPLALKEVSYGK